MSRTLVIGDIHGHYDRLEALLKQEGIIGRCPECDGFGAPPIEDDDTLICDDCDGDGIARIDFDTRVILAGDVGHFGEGSTTGDLFTWKAALAWTDVILWGNHDRAAFEDGHIFSGYMRARPETLHLVRIALSEGKLLLAVEDHGFLITHAGLHAAFRDQQVDEDLKTDPAKFADWINEITEPQSEGDRNQMAIRDAISYRRGGRVAAGGILWRDIDEKLYHGFRQIFGHSADHKKHQIRYCWPKNHSRKLREDMKGPLSYCIDVGGRGDLDGDNCLAGIYLPDETLVRVDLLHKMPIIGLDD